MNHRIKKQLNRCKVANIPPFDDSTDRIIIPKSGPSSAKPNSEIELGKSYIIFVENYIVNEPEGFTLSANWNNGTCPPENRLSVTVTQIMGKMVRVNSTGCNTKIMWTGWIPKKAINIVEEL